MPQYHLIAELIVERAKVTTFVGAVRNFQAKGGFTGVDPNFQYELWLGLESKNFRYPGPSQTTDVSSERVAALSGEDVVRFVNVWRIPTESSLDIATLMDELGLSSLYGALDASVAQESQELLVRIPWFGVPLDPENIGSRSVVRLMTRFVSTDLGAYVLHEGAIAPVVPQVVDHSLTCLGAFQNVTGPLNTITEFWLTDKPESLLDDLAKARKVIMPEWKPPKPVSAGGDSFEAAPYFPLSTGKG